MTAARPQVAAARATTRGVAHSSTPRRRARTAAAAPHAPAPHQPRPQGRLLEACAALIGEAYHRGAHLEQWEEEYDGPMRHVPPGTAQQR